MAKYGILVDYDWCTGCHTCEMACQMEHGLPIGQYGILINEIGPWEYAPEKWQYSYLPALTDQCNLCAERISMSKKPTCVQHCQAKCLHFGEVGELADMMLDSSKQALLTI